MRDSQNAGLAWATLFLVVSVTIAASGCSRAKYRLCADRDAYGAIAERNVDPRWCAHDYSIEMDPRSRYFDAYDPDHSPMPPDDPGSHQYMQCVDGMKGWKHWYRNGERMDLENPAWQQALSGYVEISEEGAVKLDVDSALRLAYVHSPLHQDQLETLYLSALDVTRERFRLDSQFFGGTLTSFQHDGGIPPELDSSRLAVDNHLDMRRHLATAGDILVDITNSFTWEFAHGDVNFASSVLSASIVQPLLRGAGKDVALEQLTFVERTLLANLRAYAQFRQGFYTLIAIGEIGVTGPQRFGTSTQLDSFSGQGGAGGYLGLLQQLQRIRNSENNLNLQLRTLARLEALLENDLIDLVQVDQFRQNIEADRSALLLSRNQLELSIDRYKKDTLGLPPDLAIELDDSLIRQFQLVPREASELQDSIVELQRRVSRLPDVPEVEVIDQALDVSFQLIEPVRQLFDGAREDLARMNEVVPRRERTMTDEEKQLFQHDRERLGRLFADLEREFDAATAKLGSLRDELSEQSRRATTVGLVSWVAEFLQLVERFVLVPAHARLETITVDSMDLESAIAFQVALANRLDFMNGRAALVDDWRQIAVTADALQSNLTVSLGGDLRTGHDNPVSFDGRNSTGRASVQFDAPLTRLEERNAYRESLIQYQRSRRVFIQSCDSLHMGLRELLRQLEQLRQNLEIQRRAVTIAIRRVDETQRRLNPPRHAPQPGERPQFGETTAINLLSSQSSLRETQNAFLAVWLNYYAARMRLYRELGIMVIDPEGRWIEFPIPGTDQEALPNGQDPGLEEIPVPPLPPIIHVSQFELAESLPDGQDVPAPDFGEAPAATRSRSGNTSGAVETGLVAPDS